jgi:hypothetical protein
MRIPMLAGALCLAALPAALSAQNFRASNTLLVQGTPDGSEIRVLFEGGALDNAYWCAAADFVIDGLRLPTRTRLFRASPQPRKQGQGITFTLDPSRATANPGLTVFGSPDGTVSAGHARRTFCRHDPFFAFP